VARNPAGFAFVEFEDERDAEDAVRGLDGTNVCGVRVRVEHSTGRVRPKPWGRGGGGGSGDRGGRFNPNDRCYECGELGHYAYDCRRRGGGGGGGGRSSSRYSRSRSRSRDRGRDRRRSYSRSRSKSPRRASRSKSR
jgi:arginine/serine-rich splicing factor 7